MSRLLREIRGVLVDMLIQPLQVILTWRSQAKAAAREMGISPQEVDILLRELAGVDRLTLAQSPEDEIELAVSLAQLTAQWQKRVQTRQPLQQLLGRTTWRNWEILVSPDVLIPRPETEQIIDIVASQLSTAPQIAAGHWADLGTGSGILACGLADLCPQAMIHAVDCSAAALAIAAQNVRNLGFMKRVTLHHGSWWTPLAAWRGQLQGMVSNPPYIPSDLIVTLEPEVRTHEPHLALDGGGDGLSAIEHLIHHAPEYLQPGGLWLIELMQGQAAEVVHRLHHHSAYEGVQIITDWSGQARFVLAFRQD